MSKTPIIPTFFLCLFSFSSAFAQDGDRLFNSIMRQQDANKDGVIERSEAKSLLLKNFEKVDRDKDGKVEEGELKDVLALLSLSHTGKSQNVPDQVELKTDIAYREGDQAWKLDLAMPKSGVSKDGKPRPAIVFIHGGGWRGGDKAGGVWRSYPIEFAKRGYVCISVNYRLAQVAPFPACVEDCKCAVRWLRANAKTYNVDSDRIGAYGNSAGAHLVSMLGLVGKDEKMEGDGPYQEFSSKICAVVPSATPADFTVWAKSNLSRRGGLLAGESDTLDERAKKASPVTYASSDAPPFLIFHGTSDSVVPLDQGNRFTDALKNAGAKEVTYKVFKGAGHGVFKQHEKETLPMMIEFFEKHLGEQ